MFLICVLAKRKAPKSSLLKLRLLTSIKISVARCIMTYNYRGMFEEVDRQLSANPAVRLYQLARQLGCSQPTIEKAVFKNTGFSFRDYKIKKLLEKGIFFYRQNYKSREIGSLLGYKWPEDFLRLIRKTTGYSLRQLAQNTSIQPLWSGKHYLTGPVK